MALPGQQQPEAAVREVGVAPITSSHSDVVNRKRKNAENRHETQDVLNSIASKCFKPIDPSKPEELNGFLEYRASQIENFLKRVGECVKC